MSNMPPDQSSGDRPAQPELPPWANRPAGQPLLADERMERYFGEKWSRVYKRKLTPFLEDPSFVPTWNWSAALALPVWFLYRKLYLAFAIFFFVPNLVFRMLTRSATPLTIDSLQKPENEWLLMMSLAVHVSAAIAAGGTANWLLFRRARAASEFVSLQHLPKPEELSLLERMGGVSRMATILFISLSMMLALSQMKGG